MKLCRPLALTREKTMKSTEPTQFLPNFSMEMLLTTYVPSSNSGNDDDNDDT